VADRPPVAGAPAGGTGPDAGVLAGGCSQFRSRQWLLLTAVASLPLTAFDALLLERKKSFFRGGFLAEDHLTSGAERLVFLATSLVSDAAVVGALLALGLWAGRRIRLTSAARACGALAVALGPLVVADVISYRLLTYLGDAFDLGLMFELTAYSPQEIFAVGASHLAVIGAAVAGAGIAILGVVWWLNRRAGTPSLNDTGSKVPRLRWPVALLVVGLSTTSLVRASSEVMENGLRRKPSGKVLGAIAETLTDLDRDGFGAIGGMPDSEPFDAAVFPYAVDVPGNDIDEDGVAGDLPHGNRYEETRDAVQSWVSRPHVVLIILESFRGDAVGATLNGRAVTPVMNALAASGISSLLAFSHNGYTAQSRHHLFSGSLAGLREPGTLIDDFKSNGYQVAYFSGQDESFGGSEFAVGFDRADVAYDARLEPNRRYSTFTTAGSLAVPFSVVTEKIRGFLAARNSVNPLLLCVNLHDTHFPYHHAGIQPLISRAAVRRGDISPTRRRDLRDMYLNTAANVDRAVGEILDDARRALGSEAAVIVTSDHGESLYEDDFLGHGYALNDAQTRIPLIIKGLPLRVHEPFAQSDLRDGLRRALSVPGDAGGPLLIADRSKRVFQYLGNLPRPRQIGFVTHEGRTIYDFRNRRVRFPGTDWQQTKVLSGERLQHFRELVQFWERMILARREKPGVGG